MKPEVVFTPVAGDFYKGSSSGTAFTDGVLMTCERGRTSGVRTERPVTGLAMIRLGTSRDVGLGGIGPA